VPNFIVKKLENDLVHLLDSVPDLICLMDFEGKYKINKAGCKILGYTEAEILYRLRLLHPADKKIMLVIFCRIKRRKHLHL
jgi:PAS domain-containing protein